MKKMFAIHPSYRVAKEVGVPLPRIYNVVKGKRSISADTALRMEAYFGLPAQFWMTLQNEYDLRTAHTTAVDRIRPHKAA